MSTDPVGSAQWHPPLMQVSVRATIHTIQIRIVLVCMFHPQNPQSPQTSAACSLAAALVHCNRKNRILPPDRVDNRLVLRGGVDHVHKNVDYFHKTVEWPCHP